MPWPHANSPFRFWVLLCGFCFWAGVHTGWGETTTLVVAADGSGQYKTVQEAINATPQSASRENPVIIRIKPGIYKELIYIQKEKRFVSLVGDEAEKTVITYGLYASLPGPDGKIISTFRTPTVFIDADDFTVENLTLENSAGPKGQALAVRIDGDRVVFRKCRFLGWQDTVLTNRGRHYFEQCDIWGHIDFIFGGSTAFFERCHIHCHDRGYVTAASTPQEQPYGFVFSNCTITSEKPGVRVFLGRPWRSYAATVFLRTRMDEGVCPEGWHNWDKPEREKTTRYAEYKSTGPGSHPGQRVAWARQLTDAEAANYTVQKVLAGTDGWNPQQARLR